MKLALHNFDKRYSMYLKLWPKIQVASKLPMLQSMGYKFKNKNYMVNKVVKFNIIVDVYGAYMAVKIVESFITS